jgi:Protein of unknown function (DUF5672)
MLNLPNVTLIMVETRQHDLANLAVQDCIRQANFGEVLVFTDRPTLFDSVGRDVMIVEDWKEKIGWCQFVWNEVPKYVRTSHALFIQWDSWIMDPEKWSTKFFEFDYIGSPWWYKDGRNVGNSGFSLKSTALIRFVRKHSARYPCTSTLEDDLMCRKYRFALEQDGFMWAPEEIASNFAFEVKRPAPDSRHFGFHAMHNWGYVLSEERLLERARVASRSPYITQNSWMWDRLLERNPKLKEDTEIVASTQKAS